MENGSTKTECLEVMSQLGEYGEECGFEPIIAVDYGSRARGLSSERSDYDVMFVYVQEPFEYVSGSTTMTYNKSVEASGMEIELHGWDIQKFIGNDGLLGSNPSAMEFVISDVMYYINSDIVSYIDEIRDHMLENFKPYALINHSRSLAASNYGKYIEESWVTEWSNAQISEFAGTPGGQVSIDEENGTVTVGVLGYENKTIDISISKAEDVGMIRKTTVDQTVKRYLNIIQALLQARYAEETHEAPPMNYDKNLEWARNALDIDGVLLQNMEDLAETKREGFGMEVPENTENMDSWIESELERDVQPHDHVNRTPDREIVHENAEQIYHTVMEGSL